MGFMNPWDEQFLRRVTRIPFHGLGLSVDVYSPPLLELVQELNHRQLPFGYLEIFKAPTSVLGSVRSRISCPYFEYHADGLWVTQPDLWEEYPIDKELDEIVSHLRTLGCCWVNQECASKQMVGYSFGTYLPPLLTHLSAEITAQNARSVQDRLDTEWDGHRSTVPLLLLETPPLTYFACGDQSYAQFFRMVSNHSPCGLVLDVGHLWTVYRYGGHSPSQNISEFLEEFLCEFPVHRVVQIHLAGLKQHPRIPMRREGGKELPPWIDAHDAPIPEVLVRMLKHLLSSGLLTSLKGIALEVDTKPIPRILEDYSRLRKIVSGWEAKAGMSHREDKLHDIGGEAFEIDCRRITEADRKFLSRAYCDFVLAVTTGSNFTQNPQDLLVKGREGWQAYSRSYLPYEILEWGGNLKEMFPRTCTALQEEGTDLSEFTTFWFQEPKPNTQLFDFFLLKIQRFVEFVRLTAPGYVALVEMEAEVLREGYELANQL